MASSVAEWSRRCGVARSRACRGDGDLGGVDVTVKGLGGGSVMSSSSCNPGLSKRKSEIQAISEG
jgi:hypothetical protein